MGADAPIPQIRISAAAPDGAPPRRVREFFILFEDKVFLSGFEFVENVFMTR
jgi:hypothetical protein